MARKSNLDAAYAAMHELMRQGRVLNATSVAREAGLTRGTLYQADKAWVDVLRMIEGELSIPLPQSQVPKMPLTSIRRYQALERRISEMEKRLVVLNDLANESQKKLLGQLHHFFVKAQTPLVSRDELSKLRREVGAYEQEAKQLAYENVRLAQTANAAKVVQIKGTKRVLSIQGSDSASECVEKFCAKFDEIFPDATTHSVITRATLVCGLPLSGKTHWIESQVPDSGGVNLYIEGVFHTADMREAVRFNLRNKGIMTIGCAWLTTHFETCLRRAFLADDGDDVPDKIERIAKNIEMVSVLENFDYIFGVLGD